MSREPRDFQEDGAVELNDDELDSVTGGGDFGAFIAMGSPRPGQTHGAETEPSVLPLRKRPGDA